MDHIKNAVQTFFYVLAGITISSATFITIFIPNIAFTINLLWQFIIMAAVCACGNFIYLSKYELSKKHMKIRNCIHYLYTNIVVLGGAFLWKWLIPGLMTQIIVMLLLIAIVYGCISIAMFRQEEKVAENLNRRLRKINSSEEEKEEI